MKLIKRTAYLLAMVLAIVPLLSCSLFDRHQKNDKGFYEMHYQCCGPLALSKAFGAFDAKRGIIYFRNPYSQEEISQRIQERGIKSKEFLSYFNKDAICITWPSEIKYAADQYGFELLRVESLDDLDPEKDIAIVLVHGKFFSKQYHWLVFPVDDVADYAGDNTDIDIVYLMKLKK